MKRTLSIRVIWSEKEEGGEYVVEVEECNKKGEE